MPERKGQFTVTLSSRPTILGYAAVAGKKEGEGPLGRYFDYIFEDTTLGEKTWEKAESAIIEACQEKGLKAKIEYGEAAIYGPKLDFMVKDAIGRRWQLGTIQVDYN